MYTLKQSLLLLAAPLCWSAAPLSAQVAVTNHAAYFNGSSYLKVSQPVLSNFTFSAWIYQDNVAKNQGTSGEGGTIFSWGSEGYDEGVMLLDTRFSRLTWGIWDKSRNSYQYVDYTGVPAGKWTHVAVTRQGNQYTLYMDGKQVEQKNINLTPTIAMCHIGVNNSGGKIIRYFQGQMDEVLLLPRACSAQEVEALMKSNDTAVGGTATFYLPFERAWNPFTDIGTHGVGIENKGVTLTTNAAGFPADYGVTLPPLSVSGVSSDNPRSLTVNLGEQRAALGTTEVTLSGCTTPVLLDGCRMEQSGVFDSVRVYLSTERDGYASDSLVAVLTGTEPEASGWALELLGNARLRYEADVAAAPDTSASASYTLGSLSVAGKWQEARPMHSTKVMLDPNYAYKPVPKTHGLIRNPAMGWVLYLDAMGQMKPNAASYAYNKGVSDPAAFWKAFDDCGATDVATIFYMRVPWSFVEPEKGKYGWNDVHSNFYKLVDGARKRGLRLAFRIYVDSKDSYQQATPDYVRTAGAQGTTKDFWTPYADDAVFLQSFKTFLQAFGKAFNNPKEVDFIDAMGLGNWGEGHGIPLKSWKLNQVLDSITTYYRTAFPDVLLGGCDGSSSTLGYSKDVVIPGRKGVTYDIRRRDSYGMKNYYTQNDRNDYVDYVINKRVALFAENGWNYFGHRATDADFQAYTGGAGCRFENVRTMMEYTLLEDVLPSRANTFDLRVPEDAVQWMKPENLDLVNRFIDEGGYRFAPVRISYAPQADSVLTIDFTFRNLGVGILPNSSPAYRGKYKLRFALVDSTGRAHTFDADPATDLSRWTNLRDATGQARCVMADSIAPGTYTLGFAIVDTRTGSPDIQMAIEQPEKVGRWYRIGTVTLTNTHSTTGLKAVRTAESAAAPGVYTIGGVRVAAGSSTRVLRSLPAGIYVVDGKKVTAP